MAYVVEIEIKHTLADHWISNDELAEICTGKFTYADAERVIRELIAEDLAAFFDEIMPDMEIRVRHDPDADK